MKTDIINSVQSSLKSHPLSVNSVCISIYLCKLLQNKITLNFLGRRPRPSSRTIFSLKSTEFILKHFWRLDFNCFQKTDKIYCINFFLQFCMYCFYSIVYSFVCTVLTVLYVLFLQYCIQFCM